VKPAPTKPDPTQSSAQTARNFFEDLGPGLITGAADDDPSGISTYSVAGASLGYGPLWTALLTFPMMAAVQLMCARLGMATGHGLAHEVRLRYPPWVLWGACALLLVANITNLGADLGGMAEVAAMVTGIHPLVWTLVFALIIVISMFRSSYHAIARVFKWLTLVLFAYVAAAFLAKPDWKAVLVATLVPHISLTREFLSVLVAILGTTISPYLFFWQAAQEVEHRRAAGLGPTKRPRLFEIKALRTDVVTGMLYSNIIMYFIILTTAATLHAHGVHDIGTAKQAAEALLPLAGPGAYWLFALGIIGTGMLGVPVLSGSCAYAIAEAAAWRGTLDSKPRRAPGFYAVIAATVGIGLLFNFVHMNAVKMLFWSAVVNGLLAPPLILLVILLTSNRKVMGDSVNSPLVRWIGWATFAFMSAAAIGMFVV
jgi:NRAMP (natural resistance-associated macrophage protein)-like metal ion transporter